MPNGSADGILSPTPSSSHRSSPESHRSAPTRPPSTADVLQAPHARLEHLAPTAPLSSSGAAAIAVTKHGSDTLPGAAAALVDAPETGSTSLSTASPEDLAAMRRAVQVALELEELIGLSIQQCLDEREMVDRELEALVTVT